MKQLPEEKELLELVEMARVAAEKARQTSEFVTAIALKWERRLEARRATKEKQEVLIREEKGDYL